MTLVLIIVVCILLVFFSWNYLSFQNVIVYGSSQLPFSTISHGFLEKIVRWFTTEISTVLISVSYQGYSVQSTLQFHLNWGKEKKCLLRVPEMNVKILPVIWTQVVNFIFHADGHYSTHKPGCNCNWFSFKVLNNLFVIIWRGIQGE